MDHEMQMIARTDSGIICNADKLAAGGRAPRLHAIQQGCYFEPGADRVDR